jgi:photosystem II stability/assembly factor-like uncharacterized protein
MELKRTKVVEFIFSIAFLFILSFMAFSQYKFIPVNLNDASAMDLYWWDTANFSQRIFAGNLYQYDNKTKSFTPLLNHLVPAVGATFANKIIVDRFDKQIIYISLFNRYGGPLFAPFGRSLDNGVSWQFVDEPFGEEKGSGNLCQGADGTLYLQVTDRSLSKFSLYRSYDRGSHWEQIQIKKGKKMIESYDLRYIWADPVKPRLLYAIWIREIWNGFEGAFLVSLDGGENWERRESGLEHNSRGYISYRCLSETVTQSSVKPYRIYLINGNGYIDGHNVMAYSDDRGMNWKMMTMNKDKSQFWFARVKPGSNKILYAVGSSPQDKMQEWGYTFYKSKDGGKNWKRSGRILNPPIGQSDHITTSWAIDVTQEGTIVLYDGQYGFLFSEDDGETFTINNSGIKIGFFDLFKSANGTLIASAFRHSFLSKDYGVSWSEPPYGTLWPICETENGYIIANDLICTNQEDFICDQFNIPHTSCAMEWIQGNDLIILGPSEPPVNPCIDSDSYFYKSTDYGKSWHQLGCIKEGQYLTVSSIVSNEYNSNLLVAAGYYNNSIPLQYGRWWDAAKGSIYISEDQGYTWNKVLGDNKIGSIISLKRDECNPNVLVAGASGFDEKGGVFVSEDFGKTWERRSEGLKGYQTNLGTFYSVVVSPVKDGVLYAAVNLNGGIYKSSDLGKTWTKIAENPVQFSDDFINQFVCISEGCDKPVTLSTLCMTDILPLDDDKESLLISTFADGIFKAEKEE